MTTEAKRSWPLTAWAPFGPGAGIAAVVALAWCVGLLLLVSRRLIVSLDSMNDYAHVWWAAKGMWHGHGVPWRMPILGHGRGLTFPYALGPWLAAAVLWPLFGERSVAIVLVLGAVAAVAGSFYAFPELARGWWIAVVLANPILVMAPLAGQLPFLWAVAFLLGAIGAWRRGHVAVAVILGALAQGTHPAVLVPLTLAVVLLGLASECGGRRLLRAWLISTALAAPALLVVALSPVAAESSLGTKVIAIAETLLARSFVVAVPAAFAWLRHRVGDRPAPALFVIAVLSNLVLLVPLQVTQGWRALGRRPDTVVADYAKSSLFRRDARYRVLRSGDSKVGMYQLLRAGARLDSEFFPESMARHSWASAAAYARFLNTRGIDRVLVFSSYDRRFETNEHALLEQLSRVPCVAGPLKVTVHSVRPGFLEYDVDRSACGRGSTNNQAARSRLASGERGVEPVCELLRGEDRVVGVYELTHCEHVGHTIDHAVGRLQVDAVKELGDVHGPLHR